MRKATAGLVLCLAGLMLAQSTDAPFKDISDPQVLALLKILYGKPGRWNVPPQDGRFLHDLVVQHGYKRGLEIGTSNGYSALWLGLAFRKNGGRLITIEVDEGRGLEARQNFEKAGLTDVVDSRINDAFLEIPTLEGPFDFVFIDAWKEDYKKFLDLVYPRVTVGGAITAHNVLSHGSGMRDFLAAIERHPQLETHIHKTSSAGVSVSFKRE